MEEKKKLNIDLWIIGIVSFFALGGVVYAMQNGMNDFAKNQSIPIALRVLTVGFLLSICNCRAGNIHRMPDSKAALS